MEQTPTAIGAGHPAEQPRPHELRVAGSCGAADGDHCVNGAAERSMTQRDEPAHRGADADHTSMCPPRDHHQRVDVVDLSLSQRGQTTARAMTAEVGGVEADAGASDTASEIDHR